VFSMHLARKVVPGWVEGVVDGNLPGVGDGYVTFGVPVAVHSDFLCPANSLQRHGCAIRLSRLAAFWLFLIVGELKRMKVFKS